MDRQLEWPWGPRHDRRAAKKQRRLTQPHTVEMRTDDPSAGLHDWTMEALKAVARRPRYGLPRIYQLVFLLTKLDLNSRCVFCKPLPHLVVRPRPLHGAGITMIVFWP